MSSTDDEWRAWGERDPYYAVNTQPAFRRINLDEKALARFFASGQEHVEWLQAICRRHVDPLFTFGHALDFGCGVGRVALPLARVATSVTGIDISPAMLLEARRHCTAAGLANVAFELSDDALSGLATRFDFVHSFVTLQHIDPRRGRLFFRRLLELTAHGGVAALHVTYARAVWAGRLGKPSPLASLSRSSHSLHAWLRRVGTRLGVVAPNPGDALPDPPMHMYSYSIDELLFIAQQAGMPSAHLEFTDHAGELGVCMLFRRPVPAPDKTRP
jgi:SAM-dependent methyltransferase